MPGESSSTIRASDAERDRMAAALAEHAGAGRLTQDELSERLDSVFAARTRGELEAVLHDLPVVPGGPDSGRGRGQARGELRGHLAAFVLVNLLLVGIWALSGAGYFWPAWPLLGWGLGLASHASEAHGGRRLLGMGCGRAGRRQRHAHL